MEYNKHLASFIQDAAVIDYYMTAVIINRYFPTYFTKGETELGNDFLRSFIMDQSNGTTFGRKKTLFLGILNTQYPHLANRYPSLTKNNIQSVIDHRNILAHSFKAPSVNTDFEERKSYIIQSLRPDWAKYKKELSFNEMQSKSELSRKIIDDMVNLYKELGLIKPVE